MILDGHPPRAFGSVAGDDEHFVAIVRGHLSGPWLGLASVWTDPDHRGQGLATKMMIALGHWAARRGGRYAYLQVPGQQCGREVRMPPSDSSTTTVTTTFGPPG